MRFIDDAGLDLIKKFEGLQLSPYLDVAGIPTIGYGTTMYPSGVRVTMKDRDITKDEAETFLENDLISACETVQAAIKKTRVSDNEFSALVSLTYNIGRNAFLGSTLLKKLLAEMPRLSIADEFLRWNKANGSTVAGLMNRRMAERKLFLTPH